MARQTAMLMAAETTPTGAEVIVQVRSSRFSIYDWQGFLHGHKPNSNEQS
jgi:hypothetical protein